MQELFSGVSVLFGPFKLGNDGTEAIDCGYGAPGSLNISFLIEEINEMKLFHHVSICKCQNTDADAQDFISKNLCCTQLFALYKMWSARPDSDSDLTYCIHTSRYISW